MADYLRQLRNDEKRCSFAMVGSLDDNIATTTAVSPLFVVPKGSMVTRIYAIIKEQFAVGSSVTVEVTDGDSVGTAYFTNLSLDTTVGEATISDVSDTEAAYSIDNSVGVTFNQAAVDSVVGEAQIIVEFTEVPVTAGAYTK